MKVLVIEDDNNKRQQLIELITKIEFCGVTETRSYHSGLTALIEGGNDLVFLDMTMPTFDRSPTQNGGRVRPFAGRDLLNQLRSRDITAHVIVFTQFGLLGEGKEQIGLVDLDRSLRGAFPGLYQGYVHYDTAQNSWRQEVLGLIASRLEAT